MAGVFSPLLLLFISLCVYVSLCVCACACKRVCVDSCVYRITIYKKEKNYKKISLVCVEIQKLCSCCGFIASSHVHMPGPEAHLIPKEHTLLGRTCTQTLSRCSPDLAGGSVNPGRSPGPTSRRSCGRQSFKLPIRT